MKKNSPLFIFAPGVLAGAERVVLTGINSLYELGSNPQIIVIKESRAPHLADNFLGLINPKIIYHIIETQKPFDLKITKKIRHIAEENNQLSIMHSHGFKALFYAYMAQTKLPLIHTHHGNTGVSLKVRAYEYLAFKLMKKCKHIIAVSDKMKMELIQKLKVPQKITTIDNMLSIKNASEIRSLRQKKLIDETKINLVFIGRLSPEKGLLTWLSYFKSFPNKDSFHLEVLGDGPELGKIKNYIHENKLDSLITLNGFITNPIDFLIRSNILIMPSLKEGLPMTLIEAASVGLPIIANDVGAISNLLKNNFNGQLVAESNEINWHEALNIAIKDINIWNANAMMESYKTEEQYSAKSWANKTLEIYSKES